MTARALNYRGAIVPDGPKWVTYRAHLAELAVQFPVGTRIVHACGRAGTVALDQPVHVPGMFDGEPSAVRLQGEWHDQPMVFASWENEHEFTWGVWVPADQVRRTSAVSANRPGNRARAGGRR
ncbi:hypothetical protein [Streptomyces sp. NBC_00996]|uniref:hypothetical protein n=1 Tax=Streptomyces sp. NBC_00996 TaxID=2903710 RepID=UPI00386579DA|nr:hypothetical protein OG390_17500 [Streptomyces sp. NBC_00996]